MVTGILIGISVLFLILSFVYGKKEPTRVKQKPEDNIPPKEEELSSKATITLTSFIQTDEEAREEIIKKVSEKSEIIELAHAIAQEIKLKSDQKKFPIKAFYVNTNHSRSSGWYLTIYLMVTKARYINNKMLDYELVNSIAINKSQGICQTAVYFTQDGMWLKRDYDDVEKLEVE